jgi:DNA polymerase III subunit gamma/tau
MAEAQFQSLYRRFRPGQFRELVGQDHVVRALQNAVRKERVSHAYLFSGPRGTGKTSSARILAKALNCLAPSEGEPCGVCASCIEIAQGTSLDVHELDAASNNGVDAMRELISHAALGTPGRWKVYIVDEVHMLSNAAANSLLKTLEEPPSHVVFVLATTDPQKVPATIRSRTQHLEFRLLGGDTLLGLLESVRESVGLDVDDDALRASVRKGRGSARDALSALDQVAASGVSESSPPELWEVVGAVAEGDASNLLVQLSKMFADGWGPQQLATDLVDDLREMFLTSLAPELCSISGSQREEFAELAKSMTLARIVRTIELLGRAMVDMRDAPDAQVVLEIATLRATMPELDEGVASLVERVSSLERSLKANTAPRVPAEHAEHRPAEVIAPPTAPEVTRRPSVGAIRRARTESPTPEGESIQEAQAESPPNGDLVRENVSNTKTSRVEIDRDSVTEAWGNGVLHELPARAKALFSGGRFISANEDCVQFALPNVAHRDRCLEHVTQVEAALAKRFGAPVRMELVIDAMDAGPQPAKAERSVEAKGTTLRKSEGEDEQIDHEELRTATSMDIDQVAEAEARLLEVFPGTSEVTA